MLTPEAHNELPEAPLVEKKPRQYSVFVAYALPLAAMLAIFGALGFGLMMINKEAVELDQLNGKYKSLQYARERIQTASNKRGGNSAIVNELVYDHDGHEELDSDNLYLEYPDDPKFRPYFQRNDAQNDFDKSDTDEISRAEQDELMDNPDYPEFRASFV